MFHQADLFLLNFVQSLRNPFLDSVMPMITAVGDYGIFWISVSCVLMCFKQTRKTGVLMLIGLCVTFVFSTIVLKHLIARDRPCIDGRALSFFYCPSGASFPSGHTISSFVAAGVLFATKTKWAWLAFVLASLIAFSRVYLHVHYPFDIIAGAGLGLLTAYLLVHKKLRTKPKEKPAN